MFSRHPKGKQLLKFFSSLAKLLGEEQTTIVSELVSVRDNVEHIREIVTLQQGCARVRGAQETLDPRQLVEDAIRLNTGALCARHIQISREYSDVPPVRVEKHKVLQVLVNLIRNVQYAVEQNDSANRRMTVKLADNGAGQVSICVADNGIGISPENLKRVFEHGFTTRKEGHGFGLHSGLIAARELGGSLTAQSEGEGKGATFTLHLPSTGHANKLFATA